VAQSGGVNGAADADALEEMSSSKPRRAFRFILRRFTISLENAGSGGNFPQLATSTSALPPGSIGIPSGPQNQNRGQGSNDQICRHAIDAAWQDAVAASLDNLKAITCGCNRIWGKWLDVPDVRQKVSG